MLLQALLIANGVLLFFVIVTAVVRFSSANKDRYQKEMSVDESVLKDDSISEQSDEVAVAPVPVAVVKEEVLPVVEEPVTEPVVSEEPAQVEEVQKDEELIIGDIDSPVKEGSFALKLLSLEASVQEYYDKINNAFLSYRRIHGRVSKSGVSYRLGRDLIAKVTVRGKTMRLNLALDVNEFSETIYFQKDMRAVKTYQDIPFMVKVKSDRGLKKALQLIEALAVKENIEKKARYFAVDSIDALKNLKK